MYNVRIFKYPDGWQVRTYSRPVGFCEDKSGLAPPDADAVGSVWDEGIGDYVDIRYNAENSCIEPFANQLAYELPNSPGSSDLDRSLSSSVSRTKRRVYYLARSNVWDWFLTLTFDPVKVDSFDYEVCVKSLSDWLRSYRRHCPDMRYIIVPEKHKSGRIHFHGLFAVCDGLSFVDSGYTADGQPVYNVGKYKLGFSTATRVKDNSRVVQYISKYITKELCMVSSGRKRYWASRNLDEADIEELLIEGTELKPYNSALETMADWCKTIEGDLMTVTYYELPLEGSQKNEKKEE